jgi:hypothetical protein
MHAPNGSRTRSHWRLPTLQRRLDFSHVMSDVELSAGFMPGLDLSEALYHEGVEPILRRHFPGLPYAAARIGPGSDVLGFDDRRSTDHFWGPLLNLFLAEDDLIRWGASIDTTLAAELPFKIRGFSTHFRAFEGDEAHLGHLGHMAPRAERPINHGVMRSTVQAYFRGYLGVDPVSALHAVDWLVMSEQHLRMFTAGRVFHDGPGELTRVRETLAYYPHDVWLYMLAAQWARIGQEEAFLGRTGEVGDELGSRLIATRLVRDVMRLAFLLERTYAPYSKWFGMAFSRLACAATLGPSLERALSATNWHEREHHLVLAYEQIASMHNAVGITELVPNAAATFHGRPFRVIHADRFAEAAEHAIADETVRQLPRRAGSVNQWSDATDILERPHLLRRSRALYTAT